MDDRRKTMKELLALFGEYLEGVGVGIERRRDKASGEVKA